MVKHRRQARGGIPWVAVRALLLFACPLVGVGVLTELYPQQPLALVLVSILSIAAAAGECLGFLLCPFSLVCSLLFLMQTTILIFFSVVELGPEPSFPPSKPDVSVDSAKFLQHGHPDVAPMPVSETSNVKAPLFPESRAANSDLPGPPMLQGRSRLSVVLACADEGQYAVKTTLKVVERTPTDILEEVIVVDDGSRVMMEQVFDDAGISSNAREAKRIRILRHETTLGLMVAKKTGGDAAKGDIIAFFDCHVSPQKNYYKEIKQLIEDNPRRMVVPAITDLDLDTWEETPTSSVNTKCYLTWNADFDWFEDESPYVPVMSGGLLALSKYWWNMTGGYDGTMRGWGGENLDQSLRSWLCGGEIMRAPSSRVAHMWRTGDRRTVSHYRSVGSALDNKLRVVTAWYGVFKVLYHGGGTPPRSLEDGSIQRVQNKLHCKPFVHFLHHFRDIYVDGGVIPVQVFQLREKNSKKCLTLQGGIVVLEECHSGERRLGDQVFHWANRIPRSGVVQRGSWQARNHNVKCCSGLRHWGSDKCLDYADNRGEVHTYLCDVTGQNLNQQYAPMDGRISHNDGRCLVRKGFSVQLQQCSNLRGDDSVWEEFGHFEPIEATLYREQLHQEGLVDAAFPAGQS